MIANSAAILSMRIPNNMTCQICGDRECRAQSHRARAAAPAKRGAGRRVQALWGCVWALRGFTQLMTGDEMTPAMPGEMASRGEGRVGAGQEVPPR